MPMTNSLYYQWINALAQRDQAMLFITLAAVASIGVWLALREVKADRRVVVYAALFLFWGSLAAMAWQVH